MSAIRMFIRYADGREFEFPVIPEEITVVDGGEYHRVSVLGLGEVALPAYRKVQEITFSSFFPYKYDPTYCQYVNLLHPVDAADVFTRIVAGTTNGGRPEIVKFIMQEEYEQGIWATWINADFSVENFTKSHRSGEMVDQWYTITMRAARVVTLEAIGSVADPNPYKPHPVVNPTSTGTGKDTEPKITKTGDNPAAVVRRTHISPTNEILQNGGDITDVYGGSHYSQSAPDDRTSTPEVTLANDASAIALGGDYANGPYLDPGFLTVEEDQGSGHIVSSQGGNFLT